MKLFEIARNFDAPSYETLLEFPGKIVILGFGSVGQAILPLVIKHFKIPESNLIVMEKDDNSLMWEERYGLTDISYLPNTEITRDNLYDTLSSVLAPGDFLINVSLNIGGIEIVKWCLMHDVMYIDTSIERWKDQPDETILDLADRTLYHTHHLLRAETAAWKNAGPTCVVTHGANPGLVTHFTKAALLDIANEMGIDHEVPSTREDWAKLMQQTGTKVIHISEKDTQVIDRPKQAGEFVNTWSCEGFWAEGRAPAEMGWGTHENDEPAGGSTHIDGPRNAAFLFQPGMATLARSWVPLGGSFNGFVIQHSEAVTLSEYFSVVDEFGETSYRPTVHYAYQPCDSAIMSVHESRGRDLQMQQAHRIVKDEITSGIDELGVLLMGHGKNAWWYGSQLGIDEARRLVPHENATSVQVAASLLGAMTWAIKNPRMGCVEPEELPFDEVLKVAKPYLGPMLSVQSDWTPLTGRSNLFDRQVDMDNPWSFENFRITW